MIAAAVAAGVAAWKASQPVEDPWKTPDCRLRRLRLPATTVNEAKDAAGTAAAAAAEKSADDSTATTRPATVVGDAPDTAKHVAVDAAEDSKDASAKVATDAKTAVRNIAASRNNDADKNAGN